MASVGTTMSTAWQAITSTVVGKTAVAAVAAVAVAAGSLAVAGAVNQDRGEVVRIIDGDTLVINYKHRDETVRLLNIDTPETKDPNQPVECLGPEATDSLKTIAPPGTKVRLDFDIEREDRYGRTLAAVFVGDSLVNAEIARRGLGHAVYVRTQQEVPKSGSRGSGTSRGVGPRACTTLPSAARFPDKFRKPLSKSRRLWPRRRTTPLRQPPRRSRLWPSPSPRLSQSSPASMQPRTQPMQSFGRLLASTDRNQLTSQIGATIRSGEVKHGQLSERRDKLKAAEEKAAAEKKAAEKKRKAAAKAKAERLAAEKKAAKERAAAERFAAEQAAAQAAEAARQAQIAAAERQRQQQQQQQQAPAPAPPASNPYPGYTGPRCYAPGGRSWSALPLARS